MSMALSQDPRLLLEIGSRCQIYSRSKGEWFEGTIDDIFMDEANGKEWLVVKYGDNKTKKIQRLCDDLDILVEVGTECSIYSRSNNKWFRGKISKIFIDTTTNKEWLTVKYGNNKSKKIQRFCKDIVFTADPESIAKSDDDTIKSDEYKIDERDLKYLLKVGSDCFIRSYVTNKWYPATVDRIIHAGNDWLVVKYGDVVKDKIIDIKRFSDNLRVQYDKSIMETNDNDSKEQQTNIEWEELLSPKFVYKKYVYSKMVKINQYEFIFATTMSRYAADSGGVYKYNAIENVWSEIIKYDENIKLYSESSPITIAFDAEKNEVYLCEDGVLIRYNLETKEFCEVKTIYDNCGMLGESIVINKEYHYIGTATDLIKTNHAMMDTGDTVLGNKSMRPWDNNEIPSSLIYLQSSNQLMIFGRSEFGEFIPRDIRAINNEIWSYDLIDGKWTKLKVKMPRIMNGFGYIITSDEKFVIFFGGTTRVNDDGNDIYEGNIYVLDLETMIFYGCTLKIPPSRTKQFNAITMPYCIGNEIQDLVYGYIKNQVVTEDDEYIIPMDIINMISIYWSKEFVYLIDRVELIPRLWRICVDDILDRIISL